MRKRKILIIDDDIYICKLLEAYLTNNGFDAIAASSRPKAEELMKSCQYDLILCDFRLPSGDGFSTLKRIRSLHPEAIVIFITGYADIRSAIKLIKAGAYDYLTKPLHHEEMLELINNALTSKETLNFNFLPEQIVFSDNRLMQHILYLAKVVAPTEMTVIIEGETGSGKEFLARKIHQNSRRSKAPFIAIDCGAIPNELAGSELFGHIKGAFTGAIKDKTGYFEQANNGTVFLDEIGNLSPDIQMKLLRAIQERIITKIGDNKQIKTDVRFLVATNEDLKEITGKGKFRKDLYHRLNEFKITIPPLRERSDDVMFYANHFLHEANRRTKSNIRGFKPEVVEAFLKYPWYGNLRELKNVVKRAVLLSEHSLISLSTLPEEIRYHVSNNIMQPEGKDNSHLKNAAIEAEREVITDTLKITNNNKTRTAQLLNIDRKTLYNKMRQLGMFPES